MYEKYMTVRIDKDSIYLVEEMCGIELVSARLNKVTNATIISFYEFFNARYRYMPIVVKNEKAFLSVIKELIPRDKPVKGKIVKLTDDYMLLDMSVKIDNEHLQVSKDKKILNDIRLIFENV